MNSLCPCSTHGNAVEPLLLTFSHSMLHFTYASVSTERGAFDGKKGIWGFSGTQIVEKIYNSLPAVWGILEPFFHNDQKVCGETFEIKTDFRERSNVDY